MVSEKDVQGIANLADISLPAEELGAFTAQFNDILDYFDILDSVEQTGTGGTDLYNIFREDEVTPSLSQADALANAGESEDGYVKAPRVM